ncbi:hypothetical protein OS493_037247, partial [Desmophyllum pertusum]
KRHGEVFAKLEGLEQRMSEDSHRFEGTLGRVSIIGKRFGRSKADSVESKADRVQVSELESKIIDLQNRSRRNNVVFWNVPEAASEKDTSMIEFINSFNRAYEVRGCRININN